jgi:hypothetical protein
MRIIATMETKIVEKFHYDNLKHSLHAKPNQIKLTCKVFEANNSAKCKNLVETLDLTEDKIAVPNEPNLAFFKNSPEHPTYAQIDLGKPEIKTSIVGPEEFKEDSGVLALFTVESYNVNDMKGTKASLRELVLLTPFDGSTMPISKRVYFSSPPKRFKGGA